jgi:hypothetical protein
MQENNYQRIEDQSNNEIKEALLTALTAKFQDYMVLIPLNSLVRPIKIIISKF